MAITASCDIAGPVSSLVIGLLAGFVHNVVFDLLLACKQDDPVGAIPVHLGCGIFGTLAVAALTGDLLSQVVGAGVAGVWTYFWSRLCFEALDKLGWLRTGPADAQFLR